MVERARVRLSDMRCCRSVRMPVVSARTDLNELRKHRVPTWWSDAKLGIFVH